MLFPKFAAHISSFKLSYFAHRSHQQIRNTFNNINLGNTVGQNAHNVGNSTAGCGLGSATGSSTAGGSGGAKWSAGSRAGWNQQTQSRLLTQANTAAQDGIGPKQNDDEEPEDFSNHCLTTIGIYNKRNGSISSRWRYDSKDTSSISALGADSAALQLRYKLNFSSAQDANPSTSLNLTNEAIISRIEPNSLNQESDLFLHQGTSANPRQSDFIDQFDGSDVLAPSPRARRFSASDARPVIGKSSTHNPQRTLSRRRYSTPTSIPEHGLELPEDLSHTLNKDSAELFAEGYPSSSGSQVLSSQRQPTNEQWLEKVVSILNPQEEHGYNIYYQLRKLLDNYLSSSSSPSPTVIDQMFWGLVVHRPSFEPIEGLLGCHRFLMNNAGFKPTAQTYSVLITSLCRRDLSNSSELEYRRNKLNQISISQMLHQSLPSLYHPPNPTTEDLKLIARLSAEPNFKYLAELFKSLDPSVRLNLQPVALDSVIQTCANIDLSNLPKTPSETAFRLDLALGAFKILEDLNACSAQSYSNLIKLFGLAKKVPRAKAMFEAYKQFKSDSVLSAKSTKKFYHEHYLQSPNPQLLPAQELSKLHDFQAPRQLDDQSDAAVSLSMLQAYLISGDSVSAVTLLEELLVSESAPNSTDRSHSDHILEIILGFIRFGDFGSASKWIKRLFNGDHASYELDQPLKRRPFLDRIVYLATEPERINQGLNVAYDAVMVSIDQIDLTLDRRALGSLLARLRHVVNCLLVQSLSSSASSLGSPKNGSDVVLRIQDTLDKSCSILCYFLKKRTALSKASPDQFSAILDVSTHRTIENILRRAVISYREIKNQWVLDPSAEMKRLGEFSEDLITRLMQHYSSLPMIWHSAPGADATEAQPESPSLTGLLTCYQDLLQFSRAENANQSDGSQNARHLQFVLQATSALILNNMTFPLAMQIYQLFVRSDPLKIRFHSISGCLVLLTVGSILEIQAREAQLLPGFLVEIPIPVSGVLEPLLAQCEKCLVEDASTFQDFDREIDANFIVYVIDKYSIPVPIGGRLNSLFDELRTKNSGNTQPSADRFANYAEEGSKYSSNRFGNLRTGERDVPESAPLNSLSPSKPSPAISPAVPSPIFSNGSGGATVPSSLPPSSPQYVSPPRTLNAFAQSFQPSSPTSSHPVRGINQQLSNVALSMFCSKDLRELDNLYGAVQHSTAMGHYLVPDASSALVETFGRLGQVQRMREMYVNAHVALAFLSNRSANDYALHAVSWSRIEDRMIIGLAYCGILEELSLHKARLFENGEAPSADAYAAMIQHAHETTDDASVALTYFEEAIQHGVTPNTFLCNTIISKLSKARRAPEALQVFDYMKQYNLPRNSVTFGAIINACCKTADYKTAESLFGEMLRSKNYKPRIPPFNTMIQLYVQGLRPPNRERALYYYDTMIKQRLPPSEHTYNLLMQAYGTIEPYDFGAMRKIFESACNDRKIVIGGSHWSTLITVKGLIEKDFEGALKLFDSIKFHPSRSTTRARQSGSELPDAVCYEALFNVFAEFKRSDLVDKYVQRMRDEGIHMTAYVVNTLIKVHASSGDIDSARGLFESLVDPPPGHAAAFNRPSSHLGGGTGGGEMIFNKSNQLLGKVGDPVYREPSCYETMIQAEVDNQNLQKANELIRRMENRAYPEALLNKARKIVLSNFNSSNGGVNFHQKKH